MRLLALILGPCLLAMAAGPAQSGAPGPSDLDLRAGLLVGGVESDGEADQPVLGGSPAPEQKSVVRAMLLSALLPGLGEIYAGGTRGYAVGGLMAATDVFSIWRYVANNRSADDRKSEYRAFAADHYNRDSLYDYVEDVIAPWSGSSELDKCRPGPSYDPEDCLEQKLDAFPLSAIGTDDYYQQISGDDRYLMGWDDWDPYSVPNHEVEWTGWNPGDRIPGDLPQTTANRQEYRRMRDDADGLYSLAERYAWIMVIGRVASMIDTAILVKIRNRDLAAVGTNPRLVVKADVLGDLKVRVGLKVRF